MSQRALVSRGRLLCKIHHFQHVIPRFLNAQFLVFSTQFIVFNAKFLTVSSSKARHRCSRRGACRCTRARYYPHQRTPQRSARRSNAEGTAYLELQNKWPFFNKISSFSGKFSIISAFSIEKNRGKIGIYIAIRYGPARPSGSHRARRSLLRRQCSGFWSRLQPAATQATCQSDIHPASNNFGRSVELSGNIAVIGCMEIKLWWGGAGVRA